MITLLTVVLALTMAHAAPPDVPPTDPDPGVAPETETSTEAVPAPAAEPRPELDLDIDENLEKAWRELPRAWLASDPADRVALIQDADDEGGATVRYLEIVVRTDPADSVRAAAVHKLGQWLAAGVESERTRQILEWVRDQGRANDRPLAKMALMRREAGGPSPVEVAPLAPRTPRPGPNSNTAAVVTWSTAYGAYVGGASGYLIGEAIEVDEAAHTTQGIAPGALIGAGVGLGTGLLVATSTNPKEADGLMLASGSLLGIYSGTQLGRALIPRGAPGEIERIHAAGLAGSIAGTGVGFLLTRRDLQPGQVMHVDLASAIGWQVAVGAADMAELDPVDNRAVHAGLELAGTAVFGGLAMAAGKMDAPQAPTLALAIGHGTWIGAMSPFLFSDHPTARQHVGGARVGLGLGYLSVLGASAVGQPSPRSAVLQSVGVVVGNAIGAGIPLIVLEDSPPRAVVAPALAGGIAGQILGAVVAPSFELTNDDAFLVSTLGAWTAYQSAGWGIYAGSVAPDQGRRALGYALTAGGVGTLTTLGIARFVDVPASGSVQLLASGGWGTWFGGWTSQLAGLDEDAAWLVTLGSGNAALLGTALAEGAGWDPTWRQVALVNGMGTIGAAAGGLVGVIGLYQEDNWDPLVASTLVGSGVGLVSGAVLAARPAKQRGAAHALSMRLPGRPSLSARPWVDDEGRPGAWVQVGLDGW